MIKIADRVFETSITTGTGTLNLGGTVPGFRTFVSAFGDGSTIAYHINNGDDWESGIGTVTAGSPDTLSRDTILASSNSNAAVNFTGELNVFCAPVAPLDVVRDSGLNITDFRGASAGTANTHTVTMPLTPTAYTDGMILIYNAPATNTSTTVNVNVDSLGNKRIKINGADPAVGQIVSGRVIVGIYNSADGWFEAINLYNVDDALSELGSAATEDVEFVRLIPQNSKSDAYTLVLSDQQKHIFHPSADTTARTWTIPANATVPFPIGTAITFVNQNGAGVITIAITSDTMRLAGEGTTGSRTLAANGVATALKVTSTEWIISGTGLT